MSILAVIYGFIINITHMLACEVCNTPLVQKSVQDDMTGLNYVGKTEFDCNCHDDNDALTINAREIEVLNFEVVKND